MKKQTFLNFAKAILTVVLIAIGAFSAITVFAPDLAEALTALVGIGEGGIGVMTATTIMTTNTRATTDAARPRSATDPGHIDEDVSKFVTMIAPDDFALDTLIREAGQSEKATDLIVNFEEVVLRGHGDTITEPFTASGTPSENQFIDLTVANPSLWAPTETIYIPSQLVGGEPLQLRIDSINPDGTLKVTAINVTGGLVPSIADNTVIKRSANAVGELKARGENKTLVPSNRWNYVQRFTAEVSEGYIRSMLDAKTEFSVKDQNYMRMYDFRTGHAKSGYFGTRAKVFSQAENEDVLYQQGIYHQLTKNLDWTSGGGITNNLWIDWCNLLFADNSGSSDRYIFAGRNLIAAISKIPSVEKQLDAQQVEIVAGVKLSKVDTMFGTLYIKHDKVFDVMGHENNGVALDLEYIIKRQFMPLTSRELKLREAGISNTNATFMEEMYCLETRYLDTHARIRMTS